MAMACFRLFTVPPLPPFPDLSVPRFSRCMALLTLLLAAFPYFRCPDFFSGGRHVIPPFDLEEHKAQRLQFGNRPIGM